METQSHQIAAFVGLYTIAMIVLGLWRTKSKSDSSEDYFLASRSLGTWSSALSGAASAESGWVLLGLVGTGYTGGLSTFWLLPGCAAGYAFNWWVLGPRLRRRAAELGAVTVVDVLAAHDPRHERLVRGIASFTILVFMVAYVAAQFNAVGKVLDMMFGLDYLWGVAAGVVIVFAYTVFGGFRASARTDFIQALLVAATLVLLPLSGLLLLDGSLSATLASEDTLHQWAGGRAGFSALGFVIGWVGIGLGYPGQPHVLARFMATRSERDLRRAGAIAIGWSTTVFTGAIFVGLIARAWLPTLADAEQALPALATQVLPAPIAGLVLAAVLAAICSTADSQLLIASSSLVHDILKLDQRTGVRRRSQLAVVGLGVLATVLAATKNRGIFDFVLYAWSALGASIGPALIGALLWPRTSSLGILTGIVGGLTTTVVWKNIDVLSGAVYELVPGFIVGLLLVRFVAPRTETRPTIDDC